MSKLTAVQKRLLKQQRARWYKLKDIPVQLQLVADNKRFIVVPAGRRSGKTERAKRKLIKACWRNPGGLYFAAAPTYTQVKKIFWKDLKQLGLTVLCDRKPSESELIIYFPNGSELHLIGLDTPSRIEGIPWDGGVIDESAYLKEEAWETSIYPALQTEDPSRADKPRPWCWLIGKPDGLNWYYRLYQYALTANDPEWNAYSWFSSEVLSAETIDAARRRMAPKQFRQEFEASFETVTGRIYDDFGPENYTNEIIKPNEEIHYFCDFNFTPMSHAIGVIRPTVANNATVEHVYCLDEIVLESAVGQHNALEFVERYKHHKNKKLWLYGDRSGRNGEKHGHETEYSTMTRVFQQHGWEVMQCVPRSNPSIKDSQNAVRAKICNANGERSLFANPVTCPWLVEGLNTVVTKEGSSFLEDDKNKYQHITTALRYFINYRWPIDQHIFDIDVAMWGEDPRFMN